MTYYKKRTDSAVRFLSDISIDKKLLPWYNFKDRYSGEIHKAGKVMTISRERFEEILTVAPLVEEVKTKSKKDEQ
jgi:hypothetical protein